MTWIRGRSFALVKINAQRYFKNHCKCHLLEDSCRDHCSERKTIFNSSYLMTSFRLRNPAHKNISAIIRTSYRPRKLNPLWYSGRIQVVKNYNYWTFYSHNSCQLTYFADDNFVFRWNRNLKDYTSNQYQLNCYGIQD